MKNSNPCYLHANVRHISSDHLIAFACGEALDASEVDHVNECPQCQALLLSSRFSVEGIKAQQSHSQVPDELRRVVQHNGPVLFPRGEVAMDVWVLGKLLDLKSSNKDQYDFLLNMIAERLCDKIVATLEFLQDPPESEIVIVAFGETIVEAANRCAQMLSLQGYQHVRVALMIKFERPTFSSSDPSIGFRGVHMFLVSDVAHSGGLVRRIEAAVASAMVDCDRKFKLHSFVVIDQSDDQCVNKSWVGLWREGLEERESLEDYRRGEGNSASLMLFDTDTSSLKSPSTRDVVVAPVDCDDSDKRKDSNQLHRRSLEVALSRVGAIRMNFREQPNSGPSYLYGVDTFRVLGLDKGFRKNLSLLFGPKSIECRRVDTYIERFCQAASKSLLSQILRMPHKVCLVAKVGTRGEVVARRLADKIVQSGSWRHPLEVVAVGGRFGTCLGLTLREAEKLRHYQCFVLIDCAVRTGGSFLAIKNVVLSAFASPLPNHSISAFAVVGERLTGLGATETNPGLDVKTWLNVPLPPPTEMTYTRQRWLRRLSQASLSLLGDDSLDLSAKLQQILKSKLKSEMGVLPEIVAPYIAIPQPQESFRNLRISSAKGSDGRAEDDQRNETSPSDCSSWQVPLMEWMARQVLTPKSIRELPAYDIDTCVVTLSLMGEFHWLTERIVPVTDREGAESSHARIYLKWWYANQSIFAMRQGCKFWTVFPLAILSAWAWLTDRIERLAFISDIVEHLPQHHPRFEPLGLDEILRVLLVSQPQSCRPRKGMKPKSDVRCDSRQLVLFADIPLSDSKGAFRRSKGVHVHILKSHSSSSYKRDNRRDNRLYLIRRLCELLIQFDSRHCAYEPVVNSEAVSIS